MEESKQSNLNPNLFNHPVRKSLSLDAYLEGVLGNNRSILGQAITLIESNRLDDQLKAEELLVECAKAQRTSYRIAITGSPGVGKSTFIESLGLFLVESGLKVAVLAIDPTSSITSGSILGDKTRMAALSHHPQAFVRPSAAGSILGGVAQKTRQAILLCEAAGYDIILVETVGVGQSETLVSSMVDFFLLLLLPGAGDELQGIKRGIVEMADFILINKADGEREGLANQTKRAYLNALKLFPPKDSGWPRSAGLSSALNNKGLAEVWDKMKEYRSFTIENKFWEANRSRQAEFWLFELVDQKLKAQFYNHPKVKEQLSNIKQQVIDGRLLPMEGARDLLGLYGQPHKFEEL